MKSTSFYKSEFVSARAQIIILILLAVATLVVFAVTSKANKALVNSQAPNGIVSFELAKDANISRDIINSWNSQAQKYAAFSLGVDYLFLFFYSSFFALAIFRVSIALKKEYKLFVKIGLFLIWAQFLAAFFDIFENYFLLQLLFGSSQLEFSSYAYILASAKFMLILAGLIYIGLGLFLLSIKTIKAKK